MAAKNGRHQRNSGSAGSATDTSATDADTIRGLIDGDGSGPTDGANASDGDTSGGSELDSGSSGSESAGSRKQRGSSERKGAGSRSSSSASAGSDRGTDSDSRSSGRNSSGANGETRQDRSAVSRSELNPKKVRIDVEPIEIPSKTKELIGNGFQAVFWMVGQVTGLGEVWELDDDGAEVLGDSAETFLKSFGKKKAQNVVKMISKIGPTVAFGGALGMAIVPRVKATVTASKNGTLKPLKERNPAPTSGGNPADTIAASGDLDTGKSRAVDPASLRAVSLTSADIKEAIPGWDQSDERIAIS